MRREYKSSNYQQVEYLQSTGAQYIDTGIVGKSGIRTYAETLFLDVTSDYVSMGSRLNSGQRIFHIAHNKDTFNYGYDNYTYTKKLLSMNTKYIIDSNLSVGSQVIKVNGETVCSASSTASIDNSCNMYIFACNNNGTAAFLSRDRCYYVEIYVNDELVRNFIPCYRQSDNKPGLYDTVSETFFINKGSGNDFTIGSVV